MADEPRKRSRFDQTEAPRKSRFDRRSRSPARGEGDGSPPVKSVEGKEANAAAAAAAAAAKINASIHAKKGIQHVEVPPIRSVSRSILQGKVLMRLCVLIWTVKTDSPTDPGAAKSPSQGGTKTDEIYTQDGDYIKDVEINDLRNRYTLTKGSTQKMVNTLLSLFEPTDTPQSTHMHILCFARHDGFGITYTLLENHQAYF